MTKLHIPTEEPELYHGVPVLGLRVDDAIPTPASPQRWAVRIYPDLARYLLTKNHNENRRLRERNVRRIAGDMAAGRWAFTPESLVFTTSGILANGQNRLTAITEVGEPVWLMVDFGWPDAIITVIDRAAARTNQDAFRVSAIPNASAVAAIVSKVWQYDQTVDQTRSWSGMPTPSAAEAIGIVLTDPEGWQKAAHVGARLYRALDKGASVTSWGAAYYLISREHQEKADAFLDEVVDGTGKPGSSSRVLADWFRRRPDAASKTGDNRESVEVIVRAFNGWLITRSFAFPKARGFRLSRVRAA